MLSKSRFNVNISHDSGEYDATLNHDGVIRYESTHNGNAMVTPSVEDWARFVKSCQHIGIDKWSTAYENAEGDIIETYWTIDIDIDGLSYKGNGDNAIPEDFDSFTAAVRRLLGGLEFA
jgi:hypothetical protein